MASLYASVRNHVFDDTDWRVKNLGLSKPNDAYYYPGANIGGPVLIPGTGFNKNRNKLFFFVAFEKALQYVQDPLLDIREAVTPTTAMRNGDYSDTAYMSNFSSSAYYASVTPCTSYGANTSLCQGTTGLINPAAIDPNGQVLINALPLPNANPATNGGYNLVSTALTFQPRDQENIKIDYNINQKNHLSGRYNRESETVPFPFGYYNNFTPNLFSADQYNHNGSNSIVTNLSTALTSTITNQLIFSYTRLNFQTYLGDPDAVSRSNLGYTAADLYNNDTEHSSERPAEYGDAGYASLYLIGGSYPTVDAPQQTYVVNENVTKLFGRHTIKAGVYFAQQQFGQLTPGSENGSIQTGDYSGAYNTGNAFADLLTGQIAGYAKAPRTSSAT